MKRIVVAAIVFAALATTAGPGAAQSFLLPSTSGKGLVLEGSHADHKEIDASFASSVWYLSGRLPLLPMLTVVADVPFSYAKVEFSELGRQSNSVFGNPYVGVELTPVRRLAIEVGTRLPLASADGESFADVLAAIADPQRMEAFADNSLPDHEPMAP